MLTNKNMLITGATGGMGRALCLTLAQEGVNLMLTATKEAELQALAADLRAFGVKVVCKAADATQEGDVHAVFALAADEFGHLDALVNLAGVSVPGKIVDTDEALYARMMDVNVKSAYLMCRFFVPLAAEHARIVNMGSMAARRTNANAPLYCTAKAALNTLSQGLALQLAPKGIHVTTLNPGGADTPFWGDRPVKRENMLTAQDVADVILFVLRAHPRMAIHCVDFESMAML